MLMVKQGIIVAVNEEDRNIMLICEDEYSSRICFFASDEVKVLNNEGMPMNFSDLHEQMRVSVIHADFMTMSLPPQTTAYEIRVL